MDVKKEFVITGEAPESDSEEEVNVTMGVVSQNQNVGDSAMPQGIVIAGEAPESDEEGKGSMSSVSSAASIASVASLSFNTKKDGTADQTRKQDSVKYSSLLHKKLRERNMSLRRNFVEYVHQTMGSAGRDLSLANQQLLKSQLQLQEATLQLHTLQANLDQLHMKLTAVTSLTFLPHINMHQS